MENLVDLNVAALHNAEAAQLVARFFEDFAKTTLDPATDPDYAELHTALQNRLPEYNAALDQVMASEETKNIAVADQLRDRQVQALRDSIKPFRTTDDAGERTAYTALSLLIAEYKAVEDNAYEEETNRLNALVQRLQGTDYLTHVQELGIGKFVTRLADANAAFNAVFSKRSHQTLQKVSYDVKKLRTDLLADYRRMANYIASNAGVRKNPFYKDVIAVLNNGRTYFASVVLSRRNAKPTMQEKP